MIRQPYFKSGKPIDIGDIVVYNNNEYEVQSITLNKDNYVLHFKNGANLSEDYDVFCQEVVHVTDICGDEISVGDLVYCNGNGKSDGSVWLVDELNCDSHPLHCHMYRFPDIVRDLRSSWVTKLHFDMGTRSEDPRSNTIVSMRTLESSIRNIMAIIKNPQRYKEYNLK